jgi:hypothetical protein
MFRSAADLCHAATKFTRNVSKLSLSPSSPNNFILRVTPSLERDAEAELSGSFADALD